MNKIVALCFGLCLALNSYAQSDLILINPNNRKLDKHFAAGAFIGYGITTISFRTRNYKPAKAIFISSGVSAMLAISKEAIDKSNGFQPDKLDVVSTVAGSIIGSIITNQVCKLLSKNRHKNNKR